MKTGPFEATRTSSALDLACRRLLPPSGRKRVAAPESLDGRGVLGSVDRRPIGPCSHTQAENTESNQERRSGFGNHVSVPPAA